MSNFIQDCLKNPSIIDCIDAYIEEWQWSDSEQPLHEFLGMSWSEYGFFVANQNYLQTIIANRKRAKKNL